MRVGRQLANRALTIAVNSPALLVADLEGHGKTSTTDSVDGILDYDWAGSPEWFTKAGLDTVDHDVDVLIALNVKIIHSKQVLEEFLLGTLEMEQVTGVMEDSKCVQLIKIDFRIVNK